MAGCVLEGLRVLDFGRFIAGPFCAAMLGDLGADVIRIERVEGGEDRFVYPVTDGGDGALFLQMNRNKRGVTLDLKATGAAEVVRRLVTSADVVIANLPETTLLDLGLDYESLKRARPDVILAAISAFGPQGPYAARLGFDGVGQAMCGGAYLTGFDRPTKSFPPWVDMMSAALATVGVLAAVHERARTGAGQLVNGSLFASALTVMNYPLIEQAMTGMDRERTGNRAQSGAPADFFETRDGWITVQVIGESLFRKWARLIGAPELLDDPRFADDASRSVNGAVLSERTARWCAALTTRDALDQLAAARIPAGPILTPREVLEDPHVEATGQFQTAAYPGAPAPIPYAMSGFTLSETPTSLRRPPPRLGEHTDEVLAELGFTPGEIDELRQARAI